MPRASTICLMRSARKSMNNRVSLSVVMCAEGGKVHIESKKVSTVELDNLAL